MHVGIASPIMTEFLKDYLSLPAGDYPKGMGGSNVTTLVKGLIENGVQVSIYTLDPAVSESRVLNGERLKIYFGRYRRERRMRDLMRCEVNQVAEFINSDRPEIVNAHWSYEYSWGAMRASLPTVYTIHDWAPTILKHSPDFYRVGRLIMQFWNLNRGAVFTTVSPYMRDKVKKYFNRNIDVIPNPIDSRFFYAKRNHSVTRLS